MNLELTDEQAAALVRELNNIVQNDRYPLSLRIVALKEILGLLRPEPARAAAAAPPPPKIYAPPTKGRWRPPPRLKRCRPTSSQTSPTNFEQ